MKNAILFGTVLTGLVLSSGVQAQNAGTDFQVFSETPGVTEFSGQMIVRPMQLDALLAQGYSRSEAVAIREAAVAGLDGWVKNHAVENDEYIIFLPAGYDENTLSAVLMGTGNYQYAEPDWFCYPDNTPNDPNFGGQWWHQNINSEAGWDLYTGDTNYIAGVVDTGVDLDHPDLQANLLPGYNSVDRKTQANGGAVNDINGHGTLTMGCVGAIGNNNNQVVGVCWNAGLLPIRTSNSSGGGAWMSDLTHGATWAAQNGAGSVSVSYSGVESSSVNTTGNTLKNTYDSLLCWAAGNSNSNLTFDWLNVIICSATDSNDNKASFSSYGTAVDVAAPGVSVLTTANGGGIASVSGTSFSTPITNGVIALLRSSTPGLTAQEAEDFLFGACKNIGSSNTFGNGLVDVGQTMADGFGGGGTTYDLVLTMGGPLVAGTQATATVTGSVWLTDVHLYHGTGLGSTFIPGIGATLEIANAKRLMTDRANAAGQADFARNLPNSLAGRTVYIEAVDDLASISEVHTETIQ